MGARLLAVLGALALAGAAPAEAADRPREGRWTGAKEGVRLSFTIHAVGGRRYIANEVSACRFARSGPEAGWEAATPDKPGERSYAWGIRDDGTIRAAPGREPDSAPWSFTGRLGGTRGTIRSPVGHGGPCPVDEPIRVRWTPAAPVESGIYEMSGPFIAEWSDGGPQFFVAGGAAVMNEFVSFQEPSFTCGTVTAFHAWIEPDASFEEEQDHVRLSGRFAGSGASGTWALTRCDLTQRPWTARLVKRQPAPEIGRIVLPPIPGGPPPALPTPSEPVEYVALGDSYSAGESVRPFDPGTATLRNTCHRSRDAYSRRLRLPGYRFHRLFFACSRAVTDNVGRLDAATGQIKGKVQHPSESTVQVQRLSLADWSAVDMVTLTIGGNDAKFAPVLIRCLVLPCHRGSRARKIKRRIALVGSKLASTYAAIAGAARNATVFVLGYPQLFPERPRPNCPIAKRTVSRPKQVFLRERGNQLNRVIRRRAAAAGFHFVDAERGFRGHEPCGPKNEWINASVIRPDPHFSFHPNRAGQAAYARILAGYIRCLAANRWPFLPSGMPENPRGRGLPAGCT